MNADFKVVVDACVLANYGVCDVLLRLAEKPRLYLPCWSDEVLAETKRTQLGDLEWPAHLAESFEASLRQEFPESLVTGYEHLVGTCTNDAKDRHVLACAIHSRSELILTFNLRDFRDEDLAPWKITARHPSDYLLTLYGINKLLVLRKLEDAARKRKCDLEDHLIDLGVFLPDFAGRVLDDLEG